jgi:hypothetical protein
MRVNKRNSRKSSGSITDKSASGKSTALNRRVLLRHRKSAPACPQAQQLIPYLGSTVANSNVK